MSVAGPAAGSLRQERAELSRLAWAFAISMVLHFLIFGGYQLGKQQHWWDNAHWPAWLNPIKRLAEALKKKEPALPLQPLQAKEPPLLFVDVNPANASLEAPKNATHYSSVNSQAANSSVDKESNLPKIDGEQKHEIKTDDVARSKIVPLQPAPAAPVAPQAKENQEQAKAKPAQSQPVGDLAMARPAEEPKPKDPGEAPHTRPRTIKEALARRQDSQLVGQKMKQEGGVHRKLDISLFDAVATPFGEYDRYLIDTIKNHWYDLLDQRNYALDNQGKVMLQFVLHPDGRVTGMTTSENTAGDVLGYICEKAILDSAPFSPWPIEMRRMIGEDRPIQFTFYYDY